MSRSSHRHRRKRLSPVLLFLRVVRLPLDVVLLSVDLLRVLVWTLAQVPRRLRGRSHGRPYPPCVNGPVEKTAHGEVHRCGWIRKYGNPFVFRWLFPGVQRLRSVAGRSFFSWGETSYRHPVSAGRLLVLSLLAAGVWGALGVGVVLVLRPGRGPWMSAGLGDRGTAPPGDRSAEATVARLAQQALQDAEALRDKGDLEGALESYREAGRANPPLLEAQIGLGKLTLALHPEHTDAARRAFETALGLDPDHPDALLGMARVRLHDGAPLQALDNVDALLALDPNHPEAGLLRAQALYRLRDLTAARTAIDQVIDANPDDPEHQLLKARIEEDLGSLDRAAGWYTRIAADSPASREAAVGIARIALRTGELDAAEKALTSVVDEADPHEDAVLLLSQVWERAGKGGRAIEWLRKTAAQRPDFIQVRERLIVLLASRGRANDAHKAAQTLLQDDPGNLAAHLQLARIYMNVGLPGEAVKHCRTVAAQNLAGSHGLLVYAQALLADGRLEEAAEVFTRLRDLSGLEEEAWLGLGRYQMVTDDAEMAERSFLEAARHAPQSAMPYLALTELMIRQNRLDEALAHSEKALELAPANPAAMNNCAALLSLTEGDLQRALDLARQAVLRMPDSPDVADTLGWIHVLLDDAPAALPYLAYAARRRPDDPLTLYHYAVALQRIGRHQEARQHLLRALNVSNDFPEAAAARRLLESTAALLDDGRERE